MLVQDKIREWMGDIPWRVRVVALLVIVIALPVWAVDALIQAWDDYTDAMRETLSALRTGKPPK